MHAVGAPVDVAASIANEVEEAARDQMPTSEIRKMVLDRLGKIRPEWVQNWEKYEASKG